MEGRESFAGRARAAVRAIPAGRVASYGAVAAAAGRPGAARAVGRVLRGVGDATDIPWWRVINGRGLITIPRSGLAAPLQRALLEDEGVVFDDAGRVDMTRFGWHFGEDDND
jgi:methylated-DNA-protein-cysteine methyltransferase related protein